MFDDDTPDRERRDDRPDGDSAVDTTSSHLRSVGPFVTHFDGSVSAAFPPGHRPRPSTVPLQIAVFLLLGALVLPSAVAALPLLVLVLVLWLLVRRWVPSLGGLRLPRPGGRAADDEGLQVVAFRVAIPGDGVPAATMAEPDFRLVLRAGAGSAPVQLGDRVSGQGRRGSGGIIEVSRLEVAGRTTLRSVALRTATPVLVGALGIAAAAVLVAYANWDRIPVMNLQTLLGPVISLVVPFLVLYVLVRMLFRRWR